jgi:HEAT repeat protein
MSILLHPFAVCWQYLKAVFLYLDRFLVWFAAPLGVNLLKPEKQYVRFLAIYALIFLLGLLSIPVLSLIGLFFGYIGVIAVGRAWVKNENNRTAIAKKLEKGKPDELPDLRGLALISALQLFVLFPLLFRQCQQTFSVFAVQGEAGFLTWFWFALDKTYLKALPDWVVLYNIHLSAIELDSEWGRHLVLVSRLTFDFILIQAIKRVYDIHVTIRECVAALKNDVDMAVLLGKRAFKPLLVALKDHDQEVRWKAVEALGKLGDRRAFEPLVLLLKERHVTNLLPLPRRDGRPARSSFTIEDEKLRYQAAKALGDLGDNRAVKPLSVALKDQDSVLRFTAAEALGNLGNVGAVKPLIRTLKDPESVVRGYAVEALGKLRDVGAVEPLILALKDSDAGVRKAAGDALVKLGNVSAVEPLILALKDPSESVRASAAEGLGELRDIRAIGPLSIALEDQDRVVRWKAVGAISKLGDENTVEPLMSALKNSDEHVRELATERLNQIGMLLGDHGDVRAVKPLILMLKNPEAAAKALVKLRVAPAGE